MINDNATMEHLEPRLPLSGAVHRSKTHYVGLCDESEQQVVPVVAYDGKDTCSIIVNGDDVDWEIQATKDKIQAIKDEIQATKDKTKPKRQRSVFCCCLGYKSGPNDPVRELVWLSSRLPKWIVSILQLRIFCIAAENTVHRFDVGTSSHSPPFSTGAENGNSDIGLRFRLRYWATLKMSPKLSCIRSTLLQKWFSARQELALCA